MAVGQSLGRCSAALGDRDPRSLSWAQVQYILEELGFDAEYANQMCRAYAAGLAQGGDEGGMQFLRLFGICRLLLKDRLRAIRLINTMWHESARRYGTNPAPIGSYAGAADDSPGYGPATRDNPHSEQAKRELRAYAREFVASWGQDVPPRQDGRINRPAATAGPSRPRGSNGESSRTGTANAGPSNADIFRAAERQRNEVDEDHAMMGLDTDGHPIPGGMHDPFGGGFVDEDDFDDGGYGAFGFRTVGYGARPRGGYGFYGRRRFY